MATQKPTSRNPWAWVPSLYITEGIPYIMAMTVSVVLYKRLGISNTDIAFYTSWLYLPWVIKPLWSPFVELYRPKLYFLPLRMIAAPGGLVIVAGYLEGSGQDIPTAWSITFFLATAVFLALFLYHF